MSSERIFINNTPPLPAKCVVCNNDFKPGKFAIDFNASLDYYGAILLCEYCIVNAAELVGMIPVAKFDLAESQATQAINSSLEANRKIRILESFVAAYFGNSEFSLDSFLSAHPDLSLLEELAERELASSGQTTGESAESAQSVTG